MLLSVNAPTTDLARSEHFYAYLTGKQSTRNPRDPKGESSYFELGEHDLVLTIYPRHDPKEGATCYFEVNDLQVAISDLKQRGGALLSGPFEIPVQSKKGKGNRHAAIVSDPDGTGVGIVET